MAVLVQTETCGFFNNYGKEKENGDNREQEDG